MNSYEQSIEKIISKYSKVYDEMTVRSREVFKRASQVLPGGVVYHARFFHPYPLYIVRAKDTFVWDVDGNRYDDYWMGHGTHILGHAPDFIIDRVYEISKHGTHLGFENIYAVEYAELLTRIVPNCKMIRFTNSGTEANMYAVRLARAYTRRRYVVKIRGGWHGGLDQLHTAVSPPFSGPESAGLPEDLIKYTVSVSYNDLEEMERILRMCDVAAIIIEPVPGAGGCIEPVDGYLKGVRELADRYGAVLIFDEVITGFRLSLGGAQEYFNVGADIVTMGKIVGGGMPGAGAFCGREELMALLDHTKHPEPRSRSFHGGTFTGNPVTIMAGFTLIDYLSRDRERYSSFNEMWGTVAKEIDRLCEEYGRPCWTTNVGSMIGIHFTKSKPRSVEDAYYLRYSSKVYEAFHLFMRINRILYLSEKMPHLLPSMVHSKEQAKKFTETFAKFLDELKLCVST
ncbi:MAG: aspartate aminotransferase family protein [Ignisphaera sp.]|nr:aspartate aminotransferase family protein [Ignisphaera sp.]MCX8167704.1 aspartate aminotransferase family protein [Ignisphaera sp.]MDW8085268.1 aspartate aminotransferase family protein [Ignisphaera sp.]